VRTGVSSSFLRGSCLLTVFTLAVIAPFSAQTDVPITERIQRVISRPEFGHANFGIEFYALDTGKVVYSLNGQKLFVAASTTKLLTEGTLLAILGGDYRFHTRIYRTGPVDPEGKLDGDLVLVASGDPNLSNRIQSDGTLMFTWDMIPRPPPIFCWKHWEKLRPPPMMFRSMALSQRNHMKMTNSVKGMHLGIVLVFSSTGTPRIATASDEYDVVILNGRVMDPESGLNATRNIGIRDGKIRALTNSPLQGRIAIDAKGLVVAPGFIDLHEHAQQPRSYAFQAYDGVPTSLELETGTDDVDKWYANRAGKTLINYGVSIGESLVRMDVMAKITDRTPLQEEASHRAPTPEEQVEILNLMTKGLRQGALAVGYDINDTPGASRWEIYESFQLAAKYSAMNDVHVRFLGTLEPGSAMEGLQELLADAIASGASLNVVHITSVGLRDTPRLLEVIKQASARGIDISTECYPYSAASGPLNTALFDPGWQERMGVSDNNLQSADTGERLTAETFAKYRKQGASVVIHLMPEEIVRQAVADPTVMIASDGGPITGPKIHPRGQETLPRPRPLRAGRKGSHVDGRATQDDADASTAPSETSSPIHR